MSFAIYAISSRRERKSKFLRFCIRTHSTIDSQTINYCFKCEIYLRLNLRSHIDIRNPFSHFEGLRVPPPSACSLSIAKGEWILLTLFFLRVSQRSLSFEGTDRAQISQERPRQSIHLANAVSPRSLIPFVRKPVLSGARAYRRKIEKRFPLVSHYDTRSPLPLYTCIRRTNDWTASVREVFTRSAGTELRSSVSRKFIVIERKKREMERLRQSQRRMKWSEWRTMGNQATYDRRESRGDGFSVKMLFFRSFTARI